jgi:hypothetical protein
MDMMKSIFGWDYFCTYLAGPLDFGDRCAPWRAEWTNDLVEMGFKREQIFDPTHKPLPKGVFEFDLDNEAEVCAHYRNKRDYKGLCRVVSTIAHADLRLVEKSDLVLVNFTRQSQKTIQPIIDEFESRFREADDTMSAWADTEYHTNRTAHGRLTAMRETFYKLVTQYLSMPQPTYGTVHEVVFATSCHKPTMIVWEGGKHTASGWIMYLVGEHNVFDTWSDLKKTLESISKGEQTYNPKDWLLFDFARLSKP